ncbi:MAG: RNA methyltransferase, partial [Acidimicrobiia bacterium]|nr:RNA methyltransferase [Acidimicrobiia bacterium]
PVGDAADPRLAPYLGLRDPARRRDLEAATGVFVAEGWKAVARLLDSGLTVRSVVVATERGERVQDELPEPEADLPLLLVPRPVLDGVAGFAVHRGVLALAERPPALDWRHLASRARRLLVVEAVNDQANLGSLFRTAAGLGVDGVLLCPKACDPFYRRTVRVSLGASFLLPSARASPWPAALDELARDGWTVAALTPQGALDLHDSALAAADRVAVLVGSEGDGLSARARRAATHQVAIPMAPGTDSLNVTVAAAIALWAARPSLRARGGG